MSQFVEIKITSFDAQQVLTLVEMERKYKDNFQVLLLLDTFRKSHKLIIDEVLGKFELNTQRNMVEVELKQSAKSTLFKKEKLLVLEFEDAVFGIQIPFSGEKRVKGNLVVVERI